VSSRKLQGGTSRGVDTNANDTRLCLTALPEDEEVAGKGALKEKVDAEGGLHAVVSKVFSMAMAPLQGQKTIGQGRGNEREGNRSRILSEEA